jgi:CheY-like chemotaxis protein
MSPEKAVVFFVEDDDDSREVSTEFLEMSGHHVVDTARSLEEALTKIPNLDKKGVNVALVDGNLSEWDTSGRDGERVAKEIKNQHPNIVVIGHALSEPIAAADVNCTKFEGSSKLAETVTSA